ncbi:MAG TPA: glycosyltransferase family 2 protein [Rhodanobacteraceae bacterium]|jgi:glycosyltransferase involved in cell wall biosynthesis|nr:glycosyltransferase family 2 protein [Rhodanobacteraceae bacterium]
MRLSTSIVLCTCNGARFLEAQWDSLLVQERLPDEIVVRDDASGDATWTLLGELSARAEDRDIRIRLIRNERNLGYVANFQAALQDASGEVLFLCDQDDVWHPGKLAALADSFERRPGLLLLCTDAQRIDEGGAGLRRSLFDVLKISRGELRRIHAGQGFGVLLRRSLATGATIALRRTLLADALPFPARWIHDEWLAIIAAARGGFDCVERPLIDYRQHPGNQLGMPERDFAARWRGLLRPAADPVETFMLRDHVLRERLGLLKEPVPASMLARVDQKLRHLDARAALRGSLWRRAGGVLRETMSGRYSRYAAGWHSALRDLLRDD